MKCSGGARQGAGGKRSEGHVSLSGVGVRRLARGAANHCEAAAGGSPRAGQCGGRVCSTAAAADQPRARGSWGKSLASAW